MYHFSFQSRWPTIFWLRLTNPSQSVLEGQWASEPQGAQILVLIWVGTFRNLDRRLNYSSMTRPVSSQECRLDLVAVDLVLTTLWPSLVFRLRMLEITTVWVTMVVRSHGDSEPYKNLLQCDCRCTTLNTLPSSNYKCSAMFSDNDHLTSLNLISSVDMILDISCVKPV